MNNQIKEILDFKENADYKKLSCDEIAILRDYITNLRTIEQQYSAILSENAELENKITNLQQERDKYKMRCYKAKKMIWDNYGVLDKYEIEMLEDILEGKSDE